MGSKDGTTAEAILDAAEKRIRAGGYGAFSFRDLATEVGVKSSSVHYHFPTKGALVVAVTRRYADRFLDRAGAAPLERRVTAFRSGFRRALTEDGLMCLCGVLGSESATLPSEVATEARRFFQRCVDALIGPRGAGGRRARDRALAIMATLEGAMLVAKALGDVTAFDRATAHLVDEDRRATAPLGDR